MAKSRGLLLPLVVFLLALACAAPSALPTRAPTAAVPSPTPTLSWPAIRIQHNSFVRRGPGREYGLVFDDGRQVRAEKGSLVRALGQTTTEERIWYLIQLPGISVSGWIPDFAGQIVHGEVPIADSLPPPPTPIPTSPPRVDTDSPGLDLGGSGSAGCCKICRTGKACGDTCISRSHTCHKGPGCACNG